jgi:RNA polymerase sigma factor (sigma-70 family)
MMAESSVELRVLASEFRPALEQYFARRVESRAAVDDLVHDTLVRLLRQPRHVNLDLVRGYVFQTANSVLVDHLRRMRARDAALENAVLPEQDEVAPERIVAGREELARVASALMELPQRTRGIFLLRRLEGMKYEEIASRLGLSLSTVEKLMSKAVAHLGARMKEDG